MRTKRIEAVLTQVKTQGGDALALMPGPNLGYLTGLSFYFGERPILALFPVDEAAGKPAFVLPALEAEKAERAGYRVFAYDDEMGHHPVYAEACKALSLSGKRVGVEALRMRVLEARLLEQHATNVMLTPVDEIIAGLRMIKSADELAKMRAAVAVAEEAFTAWLTQLRVGMTEHEAAARLVASILTHGAEALAFEPIVAGGPNGGLPHAVPGERPFEAGDWIVVDWGALVDGYASDITRMVVLGEPRGKMRQIHEIVLRANEAGRAAIKPGVEAQAIDAAARAVIEEAGYGPHFMHRTGHGLGLEAHETPYIVAGNGRSLAPGMTFTVEPGIYLPELGGVRIEDDVVVTLEGAETLTTLPRAPFIVREVEKKTP